MEVKKKIKISQKIVTDFSELVGDLNPIHINKNIRALVVF